LGLSLGLGLGLSLSLSLSLSLPAEVLTEEGCLLSVVSALCFCNNSRQNHTDPRIQPTPSSLHLSCLITIPIDIEELSYFYYNELHPPNNNKASSVKLICCIVLS